jgi:hypothetical protein
VLGKLERTLKGLQPPARFTRKFAVLRDNLNMEVQIEERIAAKAKLQEADPVAYDLAREDGARLVRRRTGALLGASSC